MTFLFGITLLIVCGLLAGELCKKIKLPPLFGMLIVGVVFGYSVLDIIPDSIMNIASELRTLALIIILLRAGLGLDLGELKQVGLSAFLMCFVPALFEIVGYTIFATLLLSLTISEALLLGSVMAAVSPAVIVPRMLKLKEEGYGVKKGVPQLVLAGASVDDIFVIMLFTAFLSLGDGGFSLAFLWQTPVSIVTGLAFGIIIGYIVSKIFQKFDISAVVKTIILVAIGVAFYTLESYIGDIVPYSGLLSVITLAATYFKMCGKETKPQQSQLNKLWLVAEVLLFTLVGAVVDLSYISENALILIAVIMVCLVVRIVGVCACFIGSKLNKKERIFCAVSYTPKATVQAAIGSIPLSMGLACGNLILSCAILAILITAPLGAFAIDMSYKKLLCCDVETVIDKENCNT